MNSLHRTASVSRTHTIVLKEIAADGNEGTKTTLVQALFDFEPQGEDELEFKRNDIITGVRVVTLAVNKTHRCSSRQIGRKLVGGYVEQSARHVSRYLRVPIHQLEVRQ